MGHVRVTDLKVQTLVWEKAHGSHRNQHAHLKCCRWLFVEYDGTVLWPLKMAEDLWKSYSVGGEQQTCMPWTSYSSFGGCTPQRYNFHILNYTVHWPHFFTSNFYAINNFLLLLTFSHLLSFILSFPHFGLCLRHLSLHCFWEGHIHELAAAMVLWLLMLQESHWFRDCCHLKNTFI